MSVLVLYCVELTSQGRDRDDAICSYGKGKNILVIKIMNARTIINNSRKYNNKKACCNFETIGYLIPVKEVEKIVTIEKIIDHDVPVYIDRIWERIVEKPKRKSRAKPKDIPEKTEKIEVKPREEPRVEQPKEKPKEAPSEPKLFRLMNRHSYILFDED